MDVQELYFDHNISLSYTQAGAKFDLVLQALFRVRNIISQQIDLMLPIQISTKSERTQSPQQTMMEEGSKGRALTKLQAVKKPIYQID